MIFSTNRLRSYTSVLYSETEVSCILPMIVYLGIDHSGSLLVSIGINYTMKSFILRLSLLVSIGYGPRAQSLRTKTYRSRVHIQLLQTSTTETNSSPKINHYDYL
jgi:hypothetical protein